jgi:hypothetical protein
MTARLGIGQCSDDDLIYSLYSSNTIRTSASAAGGPSKADFDRVPNASDLIRLERLDRRCAEHRTAAAVEGRAVQGTDEAVTAQPAFVQFRVGMGADIVERIPAFPGMAEQDTAFPDLHDAHLAFRQIGGGHHRLKVHLAHVVSAFIRSGASVPDGIALLSRGSTLAIYSAEGQLCKVAVAEWMPFE